MPDARQDTTPPLPSFGSPAPTPDTLTLRPPAPGPVPGTTPPESGFLIRLPAGTRSDGGGGQDFNPSAVPAPPGYEILGRLGQGGMGVVYRARQVGLKRLVALKMVRGGGAAVARFWAEAEVVAAVRHPHVVQVHEFGETAGLPFMVMELCGGGPLSETPLPLPPRGAAALVEKVARGVGAAHDLGIVHRDLKPGNVLFDDAGEPKVADFGLAKRAAVEMTATQAVMGTPYYMAPEQAEGRAKFAGPPADVWALGVILYELVTGRRPFEGASPQEVLARVTTADPPAVRGVARDLITVLARCLAREPELRYPTANELADDLGRFGRGEPVAARPVGWGERAVRWARRKPAAAAVWGLGLAVLVVGTSAVAAGVLWHEAERSRAHAEAAFRAEYAAKQRAEDALRGEAAAKQRAEDALRGEAAAKQNLQGALATITSDFINAKSDGEKFNGLVDGVVGQTVSDFLGGTAALRPDQRQFLERAAAIFQTRTRGTGELRDDPLTRCRNLTLLARLQDRLGRPDEADRAFADAARVAAAGPRPGAEWQVARGDLLFHHGLSRGERAEEDEAGPMLRDAVELYRGAIAADPRAAVRERLAAARHQLASWEARAGRPGDALAGFREAVRTWDALRVDLPREPEYSHAAARSRAAAARLLGETGRPADEAAARADADAALALQRDAVAARPTAEPYRGQLADILTLVGLLAADPAARADAYREALREATALAAARPGDAGYDSLLAAAKANVAGTLGADRHGEAVALYREAISLAERLVREAPPSVAARALLASHHHALAVRLRALRQLPDAERECQTACDLASGVLAASPGDTARAAAAKYLVELGTLAVLRANYAAGERALDAAWPPLAAAIKARPWASDNWTTSRAYARAAVDALANQDKYDRIAGLAERAAGVGGRPELANLDAARVWARAAQAGSRANKDATLVGGFRKACLGCVQAAVDRGLDYRTLEIAMAGDLIPFRDLPEMQVQLRRAREVMSAESPAGRSALLTGIPATSASPRPLPPDNLWDGNDR